MTKRTLQLLLTAMVAVVLMGLTGCDTPAEETGTEPTTDTVVSEDSTVPPVSETTTPNPSCLKADGPGCEDDTTDPPVEDVVEPMGCEVLPWLMARPDADKVECVSEWGTSGICDLSVYEEDGTCVVTCDPGINYLYPDDIIENTSTGFSFDAYGELVTCTLL